LLSCSLYWGIWSKNWTCWGQWFEFVLEWRGIQNPVISLSTQWSQIATELVVPGDFPGFIKSLSTEHVVCQTQVLKDWHRHTKGWAVHFGEHVIWES
jgi:hypothetical protein